MKLRRALMAVAATATLPFALTACASGDTGGKPAASGPSAGSTAGDPNAGLLSGTRLKSLLLPVGVLPKGYRADPQGTRDTGKVFEAASSSKAVDLASACPKLEASAWIETSGVPSASFAQADFVNAAQEEFNEEVDSFRGTDAKKVMKRLEQVLTHCAHFKDNSGGTAAAVTIKTTKVPKVGDETLKAVLSAPEWEGGTTLVATRVGNVVITTFYSVQSSDMGAAGLGLTEKIVARVRHAK
ncbi:hypothetical protein FCH28_02770 [Streptomyces piniterrae]|uniref:Sensor domain-containing protein n=1 Tax=Streptomyces piniterrae TaxID=2571125 RepID=A0A4V5MLZ7_9ACTN|nr:hypothetical protein [Streptomyces piniterrae]TJZ59078.1 hypothetical protein FCH28_02770 [Streptomyces piniterrae]